MDQAASKPMIVAAIDFGTTYSGWAFSFKCDFENNPTQVSFNLWKGTNLASQKGPTCILIKPNGRDTETFGFEAEKQYNDLCSKGIHKEWYYFRRFKMMLWGKEVTKNITIEDACGKRLPALLVFSLSIRFMKDAMLRVSGEKLGAHNIQDKDFLWVLTVPAIWDDKAKYFMRLAAEQAGIKSDRLIIALEPEAASLYCKHLRADKGAIADKSTFKEGKTYMVLDAGGGTVDITIHEVCHGGGLKEIDQASGGPWGGTHVDETFVNFLKQSIGEDVIRTFKTKHIEDFLELMQDFELKKRNVNAESDDLVTIRIPLQLIELIKEMKLSGLKNMTHPSEIPMKGDKMRLPAVFFRQLFNDSINSIIEHIKKLLLKPQNKSVEAILMVGGYSESPLLQQMIQTHFKHLKIVIPADAGLAVLKGAVIFGHDPIVIRERVSKYTYGVSVRGKQISPGNYTDHRFSKLITCGQQLIVGETQQERTYHPAEEDQTNVGIKIFATCDKDPTYVTDIGCERIGSFSVPIEGYGKDRNIIIRMIFGGTEIEVICVEQSTGKETKTRVVFLQ